MAMAIPTMSAAEAAATIRNGSTLAMSGYAMAGYPKAVVDALVDRKENSEDLSVFLLTGANVPWLDERLGAVELVSRRAPMVAHRAIAKQANSGTLRYVEQQMCRMPRLLRSGSFGPIDVALVEAIGFTEEGDLIPTSSIGMTHHLLDAAREIIVEVNRAQPRVLAELHDLYVPEPAPRTQPIPLTRVDERIGRGSIPVDHGKIRCIVETDRPERVGAQPKGTELTDRIAGHLFGFLEKEYARWDGLLPPIQTGFGSIADSIAAAFHRSRFRDLQFFCGGVTEPVMELLAARKAKAISVGGLGMSERVEEILEASPDIRDHLVIRNGDISNSAEVVGRLGVIALNTGIEIDIYGNVNSSHIAGTRVVNGIGGGAGFAQSAGLSVLLIPSTAKGGAISNIVPMASHVDISEHDVDIVVTENGLADLRGLDDGERADAIITVCAAEQYRGPLQSYLAAARKNVGGHHPQLPREAFDWYRLKEEGTMMGNRG